VIATNDALTTKTLQEAIDEVEHNAADQGKDGPGAGEEDGRKRRRLMQKRVAIVAEILATETNVEFKTVKKSPEVQEVIEGAVKNNLLFQMVSLPARKAIIDSMFPHEVGPGETIIKQGDENGDRFYVLEVGKCAVEVRGEDGEIKHHDMTPGSAFGEIGLLYNTPRSATVKAKTPCRLWVMERLVYKGIVQAYSKRITDEMFYLMESIPALSVLSEEQRRLLAEAMEPMEFEDGDVIFRKGDKGDRFYLVKEGHVRILVGDRVVSKVSPGQGFGERALEFDIVRTADAVCEGYVVCYTISKASFDRLLGPLHNIWRFDALRRVNILAALSDKQVLELADMMTERVFQPSEVIFEKGEIGDTFYVVEDGELRIYDEHGTEYARVFKGSCFGELALLTSDARTASVQGVTGGKLLCLHRDDFNRTLGKLEEIRLMWRMEALLRVPVLRALNHTQLLRLAQNLEQELYDEGEFIVQQGEIGDKLYIVESGLVAVLDEHGHEIRRLGGGSYFGEIALFYNTRRAASVQALCYMSVLSLVGEKAAETLEPVRRLMETNAKQYMFPKGFGFRPLRLEDLEQVTILGLGAFGVVHLVKHRGQHFALKAMSKARVKHVGLIRHVEREKEVMLECTTPFAVNLVATFSDKHYIYMLMETVMGGELFTFLQSRTYPLSEPSARFYAGCVILALEHFQERSIVFRDLKPENLLITETGYLKVADFGFAKKLWRGKTYTMCGTPDYMAPEMISHTGHSRAVDIWALGVLIYEMVVGITPFYNPRNQIDTFRRIVQCALNIPPHVSKTCADLIQSLMMINPTKRLGMGAKGIREIKEHPWFDGFDWDLLSEQRMKPPYVPSISDAEDTRNFDRINSRDPRLRMNSLDRAYKSEGDFTNF